MRATAYTAEWVLPVAAPPLRDGAVLVDERGVIRFVGPAGTLEAGDDVARIDLGPAILLPGLVNVHSHPELAGMRGLLEDMPFEKWIPTLRRAKDGALLTADDFGAAARWTCLEAMAAGVTTLGATEDSGAALQALGAAGMRGVVYREVFGPAPGSADAALRDLRDRVAAMRPHETDLVRIGISPHAPYTVSDELFRGTAALAREEKLPIAVHAGESAVESELVAQGRGSFAAGLNRRGIETPPRARSTIALLAATGVLDRRPLLIHCIATDAEDIGLIAASDAAVAHCPIANARLGHGTAPVPELLAAGVRVGLGTDSVASNNRIDILEEARVAQLLQRARLAAPGILPPERLLRLATLDGARALGLETRTGSIEVGKDADLCAVSLTAPHTRPVIDPLATVIMSARGSDVVITMVRGRVIYRDGRFTTIDPEPLRAAIDDIGRRLVAARDAR